MAKTKASEERVAYGGLLVLPQTIDVLQHWDEVHELHVKLVEFLEWLQAQHRASGVDHWEVYTEMLRARHEAKLMTSLAVRDYEESEKLAEEESEGQLPPEAAILMKSSSQLADEFLEVDRRKLEDARRDLLDAQVRYNEERIHGVSQQSG